MVQFLRPDDVRLAVQESETLATRSVLIREHRRPIGQTDAPSPHSQGIAVVTVSKVDKRHSGCWISPRDLSARAAMTKRTF